MQKPPFYRYGLPDGSPVEFDPRLYDDVWDEESLTENEMAENNDGWTGQDNGLVEEERLGGREVRLLVRAEEEWNQVMGFQRLIPSPGSAKYLRYLPRIRPADRLLAAWDSRYGAKGLEGRELLTQLCEKGVHLEGSGSNENIKARVTRVPKHIITC